MKPTLLIIFTALWICFLDRVQADEELAFSSLRNAIVATVVHHFEQQPAKKKFSVFCHSGVMTAENVPLIRKIEEELSKKLGNSKHFFVLATNTRPLKEGSLSYTDSEGNPVAIFTISNIEYIDDNKIRIDWDFGSGQLSGHGGDYIVTAGKDGFVVQSGKRSYDR